MKPADLFLLLESAYLKSHGVLPHLVRFLGGATGGTKSNLNSDEKPIGTGVLLFFFFFGVRMKKKKTKEQGNRDGVITERQIEWRSEKYEINRWLHPPHFCFLLSTSGEIHSGLGECSPVRWCRKEAMGL
jgi:hypothetical protein